MSFFLCRQIIGLEEENGNLLRNLNAKDESLRNAQSRLNAKTHELANISKQIDLTQTDLKAREDTFGSKVTIEKELDKYSLIFSV